MILADTSVLIDYLKSVNNSSSEKFQFILDFDVPFGMTSFIYQELLQGARTEKEFSELRNYLGSQVFYDVKDRKASSENAAKIYFKCKKKGLQNSSTIDCLIAQTAIENDLFLLHNDKDFEKIAKVAKLKLY